MDETKETESCKPWKERLREDPSGWVRGALIAVIGLFITLFHLYANSWWGLLSSHTPRIIHWTCLSGLTFLVYRSSGKKVWWAETLDWMLFAIAVSSGLYILVTWESITASGGYYTHWDAMVSIVLVLVILEATRRGVSNILALTAAVFIAYALWGQYLPGLLGHREYTTFRIFSFLALTPEAVFGIPIDVSATYIVMFIIFSAMANALGGGEFFTDLAFSITGRLRGGPAKAAVVSSAMFGTISGSSTANVVATGTFTIPLMKKAGYDRNFAGAVEAVASTGGQITPPVMGAGAFIMAELINVPYIKIAISAIIPAFLYFFATYVFVDLEARRVGMVPKKSEDLPRAGEVFRKRGFLSIPVITLFGFMVYGYSPMRSVFMSVLALVAVSFLSKVTRPGPMTLPHALIKAARNVIPIACACASAGIIMGVINMTGLGVKLSALITEVAGTNLLLGLFLTMIACIVLGCGMPTTAVYIIVAVLAGPSLIAAGGPPLMAHMFIFYYGCTAPITPPVAMSSYAGAAIAEGNPLIVAYNSVRIGFVAFVIPYLLVYFPELLMIGSPWAIGMALVTAMAGCVLLCGGLCGFLVRQALWWERGVCLVAGTLLFVPGWETDLAGLVLGILIVLRLKYSGGRKEEATGAGNLR
jgi:TRAP transporter 4TM/12TM fusion protein